MAQSEAPTPPQRDFQFIDVRTGQLTQYGVTFLDGLWRKIVDMQGLIPCEAAMASNVITLTPILHQEGANTYADGLTFSAVMLSTSTGNVTAKVSSGTKELETIKVLKDGGASQAGASDIESGKVYLFVYYASLDGGAGAFVLK